MKKPTSYCWNPNQLNKRAALKATCLSMNNPGFKTLDLTQGCHQWGQTRLILGFY
jgi:hypothetical protein